MKNGLTQFLDRFKLRQRTKTPFIYPARDWAVGLLVGVLIFIVGIVHGSIIFITASSQSEVTVSGTPEAVDIPYDTRAVRDVLKLYEARARVYREMRGVLPTATTTVSGESEESETPAVSAGATPVAE